MRLHANARLSVKGRELLVDRIQNAGWSLAAAAEAAGVSDRTVRKWLARYRLAGREGLLDRSSAPCLVANRTDERRVGVIAALRRLRMTGALGSWRSSSPRAMYPQRNEKRGPHVSKRSEGNKLTTLQELLQAW